MWILGVYTAEAVAVLWKYAGNQTGWLWVSFLYIFISSLGES